MRGALSIPHDSTAAIPTCIAQESVRAETAVPLLCSFAKMVMNSGCLLNNCVLERLRCEETVRPGLCNSEPSMPFIGTNALAGHVNCTTQGVYEVNIRRHRAGC